MICKHCGAAMTAHGHKLSLLDQNHQAVRR